MPSGALQITAISGLRRNVPAAAPREDEICKYIDVTTCIGSKACEVACVEWNDMPFHAPPFRTPIRRCRRRRGRVVHVYEAMAAVPATFQAMVRGTVKERWAPVRPRASQLDVIARQA